MKLFNIQLKNRLKINKKTNKGFSLIELILVMSISTIAFIGLLSMEQRKVQIQNAENAGSQYLEVGTALSNYLVREGTFLQTFVPTNTDMRIPLDALKNASGSYSGFPAHQYLPTTYQDTSLLNTNLILVVRKSVDNILTGLVISSGPILDSSGAIRYDLMGAAIKKMGPQGGMTFLNIGVLSGLGGQWQLLQSEFADINAVGKLGYRVQYQSDYDSTYLRLDGKYPMQGNLDMGNYSIKNATDISYNGWLYGNNAILTNLITGNITNTGNIQTFSINGTTTTNVGAAIANASGATPKPYANFEYMYTSCINCGINNEGPSAAPAAPGEVRIGSAGNSGLLLVQDVVLGANSNKGDMSQSALSDRLPRYVDRGVITVTNGQTLPMPQAVLVTKNTVGTSTGYVCNYYGGPTPPKAKVELVLQNNYMRSPVTGTIGLVSNATTGSNYIYQDQAVYSGINAYAIANGTTSWTIRLDSPVATTTTATALAHVYCDYGV